MIRPPILDLDLVVVPREPIREMWAAMADTLYMYKNRHHDKVVSDLLDAMLSTSPYPTAWDDVRKYVGGLERERDEATETLRYCEKQWSDERGVMIDKFVYERNRAEAAERQLSEIAGHMGSECDSDSILHVVREAEADRDIYKDRAEAAEASIAELEKRLADAERVIEPFAKLAGEYDPPEDDDNDLPFDLRHGDMTIGQLRAARAYMEGK